MYCKRYGLETIIDDKGSFKSDFGKMIIKDLYSIHTYFNKIIEIKKKK